VSERIYLDPVRCLVRFGIFTAWRAMPLLRVAFGEGFKCQKTSLARTGELHL